MDLRNDESPRLLDRWDWLIGAGVFLAALIFYVRTLAPSLLLGDSAEFQALAYTLGMAHSTGYPVYILLGKLATFLPVGDVAYRVNLFSAILAALALAEVYWIGRLLGSGRIAGLLGPAALAVCNVFWRQAVIAEVYTAAAAFLGAIVLLALLWRRSGNAWLLFWAGVLGGLSLGVHSTVSLAAPGVLVYLLAARGGRRAWGKAALGALVGVVLFLAAFFVIDGLQTPGTFTEVVRPMSDVWGYTWEDFDAPLKRFDYLFFAAQWRRQMFSSSDAEVADHAEAYFHRLGDWFPWPVLALAALGTLFLFVYPSKEMGRRWREGAFLAVVWGASYYYIINYNIGDIDTFYIPTYAVLMATVGVGLSSLIEWVSQRLKVKTPGHLGRLVGGLVSLAVVIAALLPAQGNAAAAWEARRITFLDGTDQEWYPYPVRYPESPLMTARQIVDHLEPNAIIFTTWDKLYGVLYVAAVERGRTDVIMHELYPFGSDGQLSAQTKAYMARNAGQRPIYITFEDSALSAAYRLKALDNDIPLFVLEPK